jgi:hypothetical protein
MTERVCPDCGETFRWTGTRGRPPAICAKCRAARSAKMQAGYYQKTKADPTKLAERKRAINERRKSRRRA